jgi:hypothetical protein
MINSSNLKLGSKIELLGHKIKYILGYSDNEYVLINPICCSVHNLGINLITTDMSLITILHTFDELKDKIEQEMGSQIISVTY